MQKELITSLLGLTFLIYCLLLFSLAPYTSRTDIVLLPGATVLFDPSTYWFHRTAVKLSHKTNASSVDFGLYSYASTPPSELRSLDHSFATVMPAGGTITHKAYLNAGSSFQVTYNSNASVEFLVFHSKQEYQNWKDNPVQIGPAIYYSVGFGLEMPRPFVLLKAGTVFFVWTCSNVACPNPVSLQASTNFTAVNYLLPSATARNATTPGPRLIAACTNRPNCAFDYRFASSQVSVLYLNSSADANEVRFIAENKGRLNFYFPLFLGGGTLLAAIVVAAVVLFVRYRRAHLPHTYAAIQ